MTSNPVTTRPRKSRLLFVDDESLVLQGLQRTLRCMLEQWDMTFVESGELALQALASAPYDAIITDMRMPRMDGARLLEHVKQQYPEVVRIVLSGQASQEAILRSLGPAHQYLSKPCDPKELKLRLAQAFVMRDLLQNSAVRAVVSGLKSIPSLPGLYHEIVAELGSEDASIIKIAAIVSKDAGMTAKILQLANSAFIGARSEITNPTQAVSLIGTEMVRALVLSVHVFSEFENLPGTASFWAALWEHSTAVACLAQRIAIGEKCAKTLVEESFTAGLLHDIGKLVLLAQMPKEYALLLHSIAEKQVPLAVAERERFGCTHAELGAYLMSIWGLPHPLIHAVVFHDHPGDSLENRFSSLTAVHGADALVSQGSDTLIVQDVQWDERYLAQLNLNGREPAWRTLCDQQTGPGQSRAAKGQS